MPQLQLSSMVVATQVSAVSWCYQCQHLTLPVPIALHDRRARRSSETLPQREFGGGRDREGVHDLSQSRKSRGEYLRSGYTVIHVDHH